MLPWRAIPVTLAHWREPQIIISPPLSLPLLRPPPAVSPPLGLCSVFLSPRFFLSSPHTYRHTAVLPFLRSLFLFLFPLSSTFLFFLMLFIIIPSCSLLPHCSAFIFSLLLSALHSSLTLFSEAQATTKMKDTFIKISNISLEPEKHLSTCHMCRNILKVQCWLKMCCLFLSVYFIRLHLSFSVCFW